MADTLTGIISEWRGTNQPTGANAASGLMSKLTIDGSLYHIKDPAVEQLAAELDTRLTEIEGAFEAEKVTFATGENRLTSTNVQDAIEEVVEKVIGANGDDANDETIYGAKAYAKDLVDKLAGTGWADNAKKVQEIIKEIEGSDEASAWVTLIDNLDGFGTGVNVKEYVDDAVLGASAAAISGIQALNATVSGTGTNIDVQVVETEGKITGVSILRDVTVNATDVSNAITTAISNLDATVTGTGTNIEVQVVETDGKITNVNILKDTSINATDLANKVGDLGTATTIKQYVDTATSNLDAKFATGIAHNVAVSYANENLSITTTPVTVYIPTGAQS